MPAFLQLMYVFIISPFIPLIQFQLVVATKQNLYVYALPEVSSVPSASTRSRKKSKVDGVASPLKLRETLGLPPNVGKDGSFRAIR